jgi:hypothetical protein
MIESPPVPPLAAAPPAALPAVPTAPPLDVGWPPLPVSPPVSDDGMHDAIKRATGAISKRRETIPLSPQIGRMRPIVGTAARL